MSDEKTQSVDRLADPSALGLFGLAVITLVACTQKFGITDGVTGVMSWAIFLGGCMQLIAGVFDFKKNNVFGGTAFIAYGFFWCAMAFSWAVASGIFGEQAAAAFDPKQTGVAFLAYLILTAFMTIGALRTTKVLFLIFLAIDFLFIGLALSSFGIAAEATHMLAAVSELVISLLSFYGAGANVLNRHFGEEFLPLGKAFWAKG
ncbi:acetate uptake transporter [Raoultibacter massiliensis]|uniref:Acetate uptake transporter n=1 Tax=Raoultibacter massiliensis TaxID=1852371 RepID=A0ABV1J8J3_9ACTN|nr:GPR1/FUN34/YaaH family transporter [Raoultibacter massiliensis]